MRRTETDGDDDTPPAGGADASRRSTVGRPPTAEGAASAAAKGCLEKIDYSVVDVSDFYPNLYTDYCVGSDVFATVMAWNTDKYGKPGSAGAPRSWADFWDVKKFPGTRAYRANKQLYDDFDFLTPRTFFMRFLRSLRCLRATPFALPIPKRVSR